MNSSVKYVVTIFILSIALVIAVVFGGWAFASRSDYKNNSDKKAAAASAKAAEAAKQEQKAADAETAKQPYKTYNGSLTYGGVTFNYPKTWSGLVDTTAQDEPINGIFHPDILPGTQPTMAVALRVELLAQDYASVVDNYDSQISQGDAKASAYVPPKMANVGNITPGLRLDGTIADNKQGAMVIIKVRDKTLRISTESKDYLNDFNNTVLSSLTFVP